MRFRNLRLGTWATILLAATTLIFSAAVIFTFADDGDAADVLEPRQRQLDMGWAKTPLQNTAQQEG